MEYQNLVMDYLKCRLPTFGVAEFINVRRPDFVVAVRYELIFVRPSLIIEVGPS